MASTPPPITKASIAKLVGLITNTPVSIVEEKLSDEQAQAYALNIGMILVPTEVFEPADINTDAVALAASMDPADVFTGDDGKNKLGDWARTQEIASIYGAENIAAAAAVQDPEDVFTGEAGLAKLDAWAIAAGYSKS